MATNEVPVIKADKALLSSGRLRETFFDGVVEAGCDEAGRGCLAGSVFAAAVILPRGYENAEINDSKQLTPARREQLREQIEHDAVAWAVAQVTAKEIDEINILEASILAMHRALDALSVRPQAVIADGNHFHPYQDLPCRAIIKGDATYLDIAAASILAKTHRDACMRRLHEVYPMYGWDVNKGYPTRAHREAIRQYGVSPLHRLTFRLL